MKRFVVVALAASGLSACALTNHTISPYRPDATVIAPAADSKQVGWEGLEWIPTLRNEPEAIGVKKNGYGMDTAYVFSKPKPREWLTEAAMAQFRHAGLELANVKGEAPSIAVKADQFFVEPDVGFWGAQLTAVTVLDCRVRLPKQGKVFERRFIGEDTTFEMVWSDSDFEDRLLRSAQLAFREAAHETRKLIEIEGK